MNFLSESEIGAPSGHNYQVGNKYKIYSDGYFAILYYLNTSNEWIPWRGLVNRIDTLKWDKTLLGSVTGVTASDKNNGNTLIGEVEIG